MKSFLFTILTSFLCTAVFAQKPSNQLKADQRVYEFGEIQEKNGKVSRIFTFTNIGLTPVAIVDTYSGCGCATTDYTKHPIEPGGTGRVTVTYNPAHRPGFFSKEVVVFFNNKQNYTRIWIKGTVIPYLRPVEEDHPYSFGEGVHCSLKVLDFGKVKKGSSERIEIRYANDTDKEIDLTFLVEGNNTNITYINPGKMQPNERSKMDFIYTALSEKQRNLTFNVYPCVNGKKLSTPLVVKVTETN